MNGLTGSDVDFVLEKLKVAIDQARYDCETTSAMELEDIASTIKRLRQESTTQTIRPDRVGDECWYAATSSTYRKGILRAWFEDFAIVEDCETNRATQTHDVYFSTEAPK
jgi:hypothetical protein